MIEDLRGSARNLLRRPLYPVVAVAILAIGLSASTAVFTYVRAFDQPFPGIDAGHLYRVFGTDESGEILDLSYPDFLDLMAVESSAFEAIAGDQSGFGASVRHEARTWPISASRSPPGAPSGRIPRRLCAASERRSGGYSW